MISKKQLWGWTAALFAAGAAYGGWLVLCAWNNWVTLNVRNMDVREVIRKMERQTWETIIVHAEVQGKITLQVRRAPLEEVLRIIGDQTSSRWSSVWPLYSSPRSFDKFKKSLSGEIDPAVSGWTNLQTRFGMRGGPPMGGPLFGGDVDERVNHVSLHLENKDLEFAALALNRFAQVRVVPEDGPSIQVNLKLEEARIEDAVAAIAKKAGRKWSMVYALRSEGPPGGFAARGREDGPRRRPDFADFSPERRDEMRKQREQTEQQLKEALPPEERQKVEQAEQQRREQFEQVQNMSPEQRREAFSRMGGANREQRNLSRIKNTTPEQRADRYRRMEEMRQRWAGQGGAGGGPGRRFN